MSKTLKYEFYFFYNKGLILFWKDLIFVAADSSAEQTFNLRISVGIVDELGGKLQWNPNNVENLVLNNYRLKQNHIYYNKKWEQRRWAPGRAKVYRANGWILLVPRGGRWQEVVVVVVVAGRRHLVVVVVAASLLQSPASSAGGRHLVCLSTRCYSRRLLQQMQSCREEKLRTTWNWGDAEFWILRGVGQGWGLGGGGVEETWGFPFNFTHKRF